MQPNYLLNNRYSIVRTIGQGGMGAVFEAIDIRLGNQVAIKKTLIAPTTTNDAFEREARLLARLRHHALPVVSDFFIDNGSQFLVMQYIDGDDLAKMLAYYGQPFPVAHVIQWAEGLLDALEYLHNQQPPVVHRDIKPHNLKLDSRNNIILLDFGIAKGGFGSTQTGRSIRAYTLHYAPIEQIQQQGTSAPSDIYALGATLYQLLTGKLPPSALERTAAHAMNAADPLYAAHEVNPAVSPAISSVLYKAMALQLGDRYQSANEMRLALRQAVHQVSFARVTPLQAPVVAATTAASTGPTVALGIQPSSQANYAQQTVAVPSTTTRPSYLKRLLSRLPETQLSPSTLWVHWSIANLLWPWLFMPFGFLSPVTIFILGIIAGLAQWVVLRRTIWRIVARKWFIATSIVAPIALAIGIICSSGFKPESVILTVIVNCLCGAIGGAIVGTTQWYVVRSEQTVTPLWIVVQAISWGLVVLLCTYSIGFFFIAGLINGVITGSILYYRSKSTTSKVYGVPII